MRGGRIAALAMALAPAVPAAQVAIGAAREPGATVLGRVCLDLDGDGRCGPDEPGVAGARILGEGGAVALADAGGRFHLLELPARELARDRTAYGGHAVVVEGLGVRRAFELGPGGTASVELAIPPPPAPRASPLVAAGEAGPPPARGADGKLRWWLSARTAPGAAVVAGGAPVQAGDDGVFSIEVALSPGENRLALGVGSAGAVALYRWSVHLVPRSRGGELVVPGRPEPIGVLALAPIQGGAALVSGELAPGLRLRAGGLLAGAGRFSAFAPPGAGPLELVDGAGAIVLRVPVPAGDLSPLPATWGATGVALAEMEVSFLGSPRVLVTGRGAGAAHGQLGPLAFEAGLDLDDRDDRLSDLARPRSALAAEHALDAARTFPAVGDEGAADDRNPARGRVWAQVRTGADRLELGSARAGLTGSELGRYDRALFGAKLQTDRAVGPLRLRAAAFGATLREDAGGNPPPRAAHDVLRATGGAALWLSHGEVVEGSEAVRIERRDPFTGRIVSQRALARAVDYEIDFVSGRIVLAAPLASVAPPAAVLTGDPFAAPEVTVVADYLHAAPGPTAEDLHGGRVGAALGPVAVFAHAAGEERPGRGDDWSLAGGGAELDLGPALRVRAEAARSRGQLFARAGATEFARSEDGGLRFASPAAADAGADALHVEANGNAGPVRADAWWRTRERGYSDAEFLEAVAARERGASLSAGAGSVSGVVRLAERRGADPRDPAALARLDERQLLARAAWQGERLGLAVEGVQTSREDAAATAEATSAGARASWRVDPALTVDAAHHQKLRLSGPAVDPTFTSAGAAFARGSASLGVRGGWGPELGPRLLVSGARLAPGEALYGTFGADPDAPDVLGGAASALGVRQRTRGAELFTEEQFGRDPFGLRQARVLGATVEPLRGVTLSLSGERGERLRLDGSVVARSAAAAAIGMVRGSLRLAARGEVRDEGGDGHAAAGASAEWLVRPGASLAARVSWTHGTSAGVEGLGFEASLGGAWRADRLALLASLARFAERRPGEARRDGVLARLAATTAGPARVRAGLGAAVAVQEVAGARADRLSGSARVQVRIAGPLDAAGEYARRAPLSGPRLGALDAVRAEAGLGAGEGRIAVGYNLVGFGGDGLSPAADTGRLYVRAQLVY